MIIVLVLTSLIAYIATMGAFNVEEIGAIAVIVGLVAFAAYTIWDRAKNTSKRLPTEDERIKNVTYKAGYYGFIAAIWSAVFTPIATNILFDAEMESNHVTASVVIIAAIVFAASYLYLARKGTK